MLGGIFFSFLYLFEQLPTVSFIQRVGIYFLSIFLGFALHFTFLSITINTNYLIYVNIIEIKVKQNNMALEFYCQNSCLYSFIPHGCPEMIFSLTFGEIILMKLVIMNTMKKNIIKYSPKNNIIILFPKCFPVVNLLNYLVFFLLLLLQIHLFSYPNSSPHLSHYF